MDTWVSVNRAANILFTTTAMALAMAAQSVHAQCVVDAEGVCTITNSGTSGDIVADPPTRIINTGTTGAISQSSGGFLLVDNRAGGTVASATFSGPAVPTSGTPHTPDGLTGNIIINAGTVAGNVSLAPVGSIFVNNGGTVTGSVTTVLAGPVQGQGSLFINRASTDTGVAGTLNFVGSTDKFVTSFNASGSYNLSTMLPTSFESGGAEALGDATIVTLTGSGNDVVLLGNGSVINEGTIGSNDFWLPNIGQVFQTSTGSLKNPAITYRGVVGEEYLVNLGTDPKLGPVSLQYGGALTSFTNNGEINGDLTYLRTASFTNSGDINLRSSDLGTVIISAADVDFTFANSGTIAMTNTGTRALPFETLPDSAIALVTAINATTLKAVNIANTATGEIIGGLSFIGVASDFVFDNAGTIGIGGNPNDIDRAVEIQIGDFDVALDPEFQGDVPTNSATITNSGTLDGGIDFSGTPRTFVFTNDGTITSDVTDPYAEAVDIEVTGYDVPGSEEETDAESVSFTNNGTIEGTVGFSEIEASVITFVNTGDITRGLTPGGTLFAEAFGGVEIDQETTLGATLTFTNSGTISTADHAGAAVSLYVEAGDLDSGDPLAATAVANVTVVNSGTIHASGGTYITPGTYLGQPANQLLTDFGAALAVDTDAEGVSSISITNAAGGIISGRGPAYLGTPTGAQLIANQPANASTLTIAAHADMVTIVNNGTILGGPGGPLTLPTGQTLVPTVDADIDFENIIGTAIDTFDSTDLITNGATGVIEGGIALRGGDDVLKNYGSITGNISFGTGDDTFIQGISAVFTGTADGGEGMDMFLIDISGGGTINQALYDQITGFETVALTLSDGSIFTGAATGGDTDTLSVSFAGTDTDRSVVDFSDFSDFETLSVGGGTGVVEGSLAFEQIDISGGRLIGSAGSTITGSVAVGSGGTFGSAGTVVGDVAVDGTLSPGASPGTMTIVGDVSLASGSTTLFEMTPTVSDAIVITGALTIATGTTLEITGQRPPTPGVAYDLITATDGITGSFTTINKADAVLGYISQSANAIQLLGTFQLEAGGSAQSILTTNYLNGLLVGGTASAGILTAVPNLLLANGYADEAAIATISPEAYASAVQMGIENGLAISSAVRSASIARASEGSGLFTFGAGFGGRRTFAADAGAGVSKANVRSTGIMGGIGYGNALIAVSAFVGRSDLGQSIGTIGARNDADGLFAGGNARLTSGKLRAGASAIWDRSNTDTNRTLFDASTATSHYRLRGLTFDGYVGYGFDVGSDWQLGPEIGLTHVSIKRGALTESGGGAFALAVAAERYKAIFISGDLTLTRPNADIWRPYLSAGIRHMIDGDKIVATGNFVGTATAYTVPGARRDKSFANIGAGFEVKVSPNVSLFARGNSEFGADNNGQSINGGLRASF